MSGKVLIVDPVSTNRILMRGKLTACYFETVTADTGAEALDILKSQQITMVVTHETVEGFNIKEFISEIKKIDTLLPVLVYLPEHRSAARLAVLRNGVDEVLSEPINDLLLRSRVRALMRQRKLDQTTLPKDVIENWGLAEPAAGFVAKPDLAIQSNGLLPDSYWNHLRHIAAKFSACHAAETARDGAYMIIDIPKKSDTALRRLSAAIAESHPVCVIAATDDIAAQALDIGADLACVAPIALDELAQRLRNSLTRIATRHTRTSVMQKSIASSMQDALTGLKNRHFILPLLRDLIERQPLSRNGIGLIMIDLDHFKSVNDCFGHRGGDRILKEVANRLIRRARTCDHLARIGGEEFLLVARNMTLKMLNDTGRMMCDSIAAHPFYPAADARPINLTASVGCAYIPDCDANPLADPEDYIEMADRALYRAKQTGRNRVIAA